MFDKSKAALGSGCTKVVSRPAADIRRIKLLGATHAPHEGGCMLVCARDDIYRMTDLRGPGCKQRD